MVGVPFAKFALNGSFASISEDANSDPENSKFNGTAQKHCLKSVVAAALEEKTSDARNTQQSQRRQCVHRSAPATAAVQRVREGTAWRFVQQESEEQGPSTSL